MTAAAGWIIVGVMALLTWIPIDVWLKVHKKRLLTNQMSEWIHNPGIGPWMLAFLAFVVVLFMLHMIMAHK